MRIKFISIILAFLYTHQLYTSAITIEFIKMTLMIHIDHFPLDFYPQEQDIGNHDNESLLRTLGPRKRKALELFKMFSVVTAAQIGQLFGFRPRTGAQLCKNWVEEGFLVIVNPSNKNRSYSLSPKYEVLVRSLI